MEKNTQTYSLFKESFVLKEKKYSVDLLDKILFHEPKILMNARIKNIINDTQNVAALKINGKIREFTIELVENTVSFIHTCHSKYLEEIKQWFNEKSYEVEDIAKKKSFSIIKNFILPLNVYGTLIDVEEKLPYGLSISTITLTFKTNAAFNYLTIGKHITIEKYKRVELASFIYNHKHHHRMEKIPQKKDKSAFYNQVSLEVKVLSKVKELNIKLFAKQSVQLTGVKKVSDLIEIVYILNNLFKEEKYLFKKNDKGEYYPEKIIFAENSNEFDPERIFDIKIRMVNSNYSIESKIDRSLLYNLVKSKSMYITFEKTSHSSVDIKYEIEGRNDPKSNYVSIFVFETGAIIITGAKSVDELIKAYVFINKLLYENYHKIVKIELLI